MANSAFRVDDLAAANSISISSVSLTVVNGNLVLPAGTTVANVAIGSGGGATVTVSNTIPATTTEGSLWLDSDTGDLSVYYGGDWAGVGTGPQGATGPAGSAGNIGATGATGIQGNIGPAGATGVGTVGATGATGAPGSPGAGGNVYDTLPTSTGYLAVSVGTTAQRPVTGAAGMIRYNTTLGYIEWYDNAGATWRAITQGSSFSVEYLVVAGGGGGATAASSNTRGGGGGGAGGFRSGTLTGLLTNTTYNITVGGGGAGKSSLAQDGSSGSNSTFSDITSAGGGGGGTEGRAGANGGSGGGGGAGGGGGSGNTPSTTPSQGNNGGASSSAGSTAGGSGGGAGGAGTSGASYGYSAAVPVGAGVTNSITGETVTYSTGGTGGGGTGNYSAASANSGNGGVGGGNPNSGSGGSGVVIIKVPSSISGTFSGGITAELINLSGYKVYKITAGTGTVTFT